MHSMKTDGLGNLGLYNWSPAKTRATASFTRYGRYSFNAAYAAESMILPAMAAPWPIRDLESCPRRAWRSNTAEKQRHSLGKCLLSLEDGLTSPCAYSPSSL
jgi:hypothetical protein